MFPHLSLPWASGQRGGCGCSQFVRGVSRAGAPGSRSPLGACLAYSVLGCLVKMSPEEAKMRIYVELYMQMDVYKKHIVDLLGSLKPGGRAALSRE